MKAFVSERRKEFIDAIKAEPLWSLYGFAVLLAFDLAALAHWAVSLFKHYFQQ